ncbi:MAG: 2-amino-4-hydroxy-6-hydroxymethyldihydropteridine diphosphokinase [Candidatus Krumholzibacteriota bacterium]|nr:2-amino-4-hydroxy-6-hydroxymethyldihydropteridine diphosphokinase [Candidatus Krumholzibacteriota bacterium]
MPTEIIVAFSIGSNIGAREERVLEGAARLGRTPGLRELELGVLYETRPVGRGYGRSFVNTACIARTALEPRALLGRCEEIERLAGRAAKGRGADRTLDIDLLLYGSLLLDEPGLVLPHPRLAERLFVLVPLAGIAPDLPVPPGGETVSALASRLEDPDWGRIVSRRFGASRTP